MSWIFVVVFTKKSQTNKIHTVVLISAFLQSSQEKIDKVVKPRFFHERRLFICTPFGSSFT